MEKENNRSAAGLRRSVVAERLRLRQEWSALKGTNSVAEPRPKNNTVLTKKSQNIVVSFPKNFGTTIKSQADFAAVSEVLRGTVVLVDVGSEPKALPLRAALTALGASVVPTWSPLVTHLIWSQGGCRSLRAKARALACQLVSPLWVEACAAAGRRLPEKVFPAPTRPSDLPSPTTLKRLLKKAEQENITLQNLLSDSAESEKGKPPRLRISSETEHDTTNTTDTSHDTSADRSRDKTDQTLSPDPETRVNTAPRRALPVSITPQRPTKSKRKLFTQKEADINTDDESDKETPAVSKKMQPKLTQRGRRELAHAERIARRLMGTPKRKQTDRSIRNHSDRTPRVVLTGMCKQERHEIWEAIRQLNGKIQNQVNKRTTHILMGSCTDTPVTNKRTDRTSNQGKQIIMCDKCNTPEDILSQMFLNNITVQSRHGNTENVICRCYDNISGVQNISSSSIPHNIVTGINKYINYDKNPANNYIMTEKSGNNLNDCLRNGKLGNANVLLSRNNRTNSLNNDVTTVENAYNLKSSLRNDKHLTVNRLINGNDKVAVETCNDLCAFSVNNDESKTVKALHGGNDKTLLSKVITEVNCDNLCSGVKNDKPRTVNALLGAARGCRVLRAQWARACVKAKRWLHHYGYEVPHLMKISQKARVERLALNKMRTEYAYDVFNGMRVRVSENAEQKDAVNQLLTLCGAITQNGGDKRNGGKNQNGGNTAAEFDITIGRESGEVSSKWVFDSVASARIRTTRRYVNKDVSSDIVVLS